jgi:hypothetical protein
MPLSLYAQTVPVFARLLDNLSRILDKTEQFCVERKIDPIVLLNSRLAPDMFPLSKQVQIACDFAKGAAARFAAVDVPKYEDTEASIADLKVRIAKTVAFAKSLPEARFEGADSRSVTIPLRGEPTTFDALTYLNNVVMPNFYFHLTTAYVILRHNGVPLGKSDFTGPMK